MKEETTLSISKPTPDWARWAFRIILWGLSFATLAINTLNVERMGLTSLDVKDTTALFSLLILGAHSLSRMIGKDIKPEEYQIK